jgi:hypothetical protein
VFGERRGLLDALGRFTFLRHFRADAEMIGNHRELRIALGDSCEMRHGRAVEHHR